MTFPTDRTRGQRHTLNGRTWEWNGRRWAATTAKAAPGVGFDIIAAVFTGTFPRAVTLTGTHVAPAGGWKFARTGTAQNPYVFAGPARLRSTTGRVVESTGTHVRFDGLTICDPSDAPESRRGPGNDNPRGNGIGLYRADNTVRHCVMVDLGSPISSGVRGGGSLMYGNVILDCGWYWSDRGHGHGMYLQNDPGAGKQTVKHNVIGYTAASGIKAAGDEGDASDFDVIGNTIVHPNDRDQANALSAFIHYSRDNSSGGMVWDGNWSIVSGVHRQGYWLGWLEKTPIDKDFAIVNAWHHGGHGVVVNYPWESITITDSVFYAGSTCHFYDEKRSGTLARTFDGVAFYGGKAKPFCLDGGPDLTFDEFVTATGATGCTYHPGEEPPARAEVLPDDYIANRAIVRVWNPSEAASVTVDTPGLTGAWQLLDALNPEAGPVATGTHSGTVVVPMTGLQLRTPAGLERLPHPGPRFGVFILKPA